MNTKGFGIILSLVAVIGAWQLVKHERHNEFALADAKARVAPIKPNAINAAELTKPDLSTQRRILENYGKLPLTFEENRGQVDPRVKFVSHGAGYTLFLTPDEAVLSVSEGKASDKRPRTNRGNQVHQSPVMDRRLSSSRSEQQTRNLNLSMKLVGSDPRATVSGFDELSSKSNFLIGNDPKKWQTNVANYAKVRYAGVYPGVDLIYYGNQDKLEYDFVVAPGADLRRIQFDVRGTKWIRRDEHGDLVLKMKMDEHEIRWHKPVVYQEKNGTRQLVAAHYAITDTNRVGFEVEEYDASRPLYIDPVIYSTYLGGSAGEEGYAIAADNSGNAYVTGETGSTDFPTTPGAFQKICSDCSTVGSAFVTKLNASGSALVYSTYLGGSGGASYGDFGSGIAVDSSGNAYVTGETNSTDFPTTPGAFQTVCNGGSGCATYSDAFVTKLNSTGSALVYSTYLGGNSYDRPFGIAVDSSGNAYVTGWTRSTDFPTKNALQPQNIGGSSNAFVTKLNASGSALDYSTYLGGGGEYGFGIAVDGSGNAYVTGITGSTDFPTTPGAFQTTCSSGGACIQVAFVTKYNPTGSALVYSTFLRGTAGGNAAGQGIAVDTVGNAYVTGSTGADFPTTPGAFQRVYKDTGGGPDNPSNGAAFVTKFNSTGSALLYSTYLGGSTYESANGIAVDSSGNAYVTGQTGSTDFPTTSGAFQKVCNGGSGCSTSPDAFVTEFNPSGSALLYSSYLGGTNWEQFPAIAVDSSGNAYVTGQTASTDFPTTTGAFQTACSGCDGTAFVAKFALGSTSGPAANVTPSNLAFGQAVIGTTSSSKTITVSNNGGAALSISSIDVTGTNSSDFNQTNNCGVSVAANASCTIEVTFTPSATGARAASIVITDNAANSPQTVSLTGTGSAGTTSATLSPTSLAFSSQVVGSSSTTQAITLTNGGTAPLSISSIAVAGANSGDFTQTDTCGSGVAAGSICTINVTFKPSATGTRSASVTVTDNAANSPQTVPLTGSGTDFSFGVANGGSNTATVSAGNKATYNLQVTPMNGFSGAVALSCGGAPSEATCSVSPSSLTLNGAAGAFTVTVSTKSSSIVIPNVRPDGWRQPILVLSYFFLALLTFVFLTGIGESASGLRKHFAYVPTLAASLLVLAWVGGCSGVNTVHTHNPGTPTGTSTLTISGTSNGVTRTQSLTLTVQ